MKSENSENLLRHEGLFVKIATVKTQIVLLNKVLVSDQKYSHEVLVTLFITPKI